MMNSVQTPSTVVIPAERKCPRCGATLGGFGPEGLCGACMFDGAIAGEETPDLLASGPRRFGDYELLEEIARGGMGVIFKARQLSLNRVVAVKMILRGEFAGVAELARFRAEAETAARLQHPNIVAIHEVGEYEGQPFFSMDYVEGQNLAQLVGNTSLPAARAAKYLETIAEAVQYAHNQGVLHRDLKPSNVLIDSATDTPRVTDFGLAKRLEGDASLTITGQVLGSPNFMPPEQAAGKGNAISPASDVYSLGAVLYHALTGRPPFMAESVPATLRLVEESEAVSPRLLAPSVPADLETICLKCLQKERTRRYATAQEFAEDLARFLRDEPIRARPVSRSERFWRWCRRNRALASAGATALVLLLVVAIGSPIAALRINRERQRAEDNAGKAQQAAKLEAEHRVRAEKLAEDNRVNLYAARVKLAEQSLKEGNVKRATNILASLVPQAGQSELRSFDWYYLWQICHSERLVVGGNIGRVRCVRFSPDGSVFAVAGDDMLIRIYDTTSGARRVELAGHTAATTALVWTPDQRYLVSASADGSIRFWDVASGRETRMLRADTNALSSIVISPDGRWLAAGEGQLAGAGNPGTRYSPVNSPGQIQIWKVEDGRLARRIPGHASGVYALACGVKPPGFFSSGFDRVVRWYDWEAGRTETSLVVFSGPILDLAVSPDGREVVAASWFRYSESGEIKILDSKTLAETRDFPVAVGRVLRIALSPAGRTLASAGADHVTHLWDFETAALMSELNGHEVEIGALAFSPDGDSVLTGGWDKTARIWNAHDPPAQQLIPTENSYCVAFSPDGKLLASGGRQVEVREAATGGQPRVLPEYRSVDIRVAFVPDGSALVGFGHDGTLHFWDSQTWRHWTTAEPLPNRTPNNDLGGVNSDGQFAISPDSRVVAVSCYDRVIRFYDPRTGNLTGQIDHWTNKVSTLAFTADSKRLVMRDNIYLSFWDVATWRLESAIRESGNLVRVSRDGRWLASGKFQSGIKLRDTDTMRIHANLSGHKDTIFGLAISGDSRLVATTSSDGSVKLWNTASGQELLNVRIQSGVIWSVAFAPDDRTLAFSSGSTIKGSGRIAILRARNR